MRTDIAITKREAPGWDTFTGTAECMIGAGLVTAEQVPGEPGRPRLMMTFYAGQPVAKGAAVPRDERYLQVRRTSARRIEVTVGLTLTERARRDVARTTDDDRWLDWASPEVRGRLALLRARGDAAFRGFMNSIEG